MRYNHVKEEQYKVQITRTPPTTVNKSTFITTSIAVHSQEEVDDFIDFINSSKEFADATHNMVVYRYYAADGQLVEGDDDDGEHGAGTKILFLM